VGIHSQGADSGRLLFLTSIHSTCFAYLPTYEYTNVYTQAERMHETKNVLYCVYIDVNAIYWHLQNENACTVRSVVKIMLTVTM